MRTINLKWKDFQLYEKIYIYFKPLWFVLSDSIKKERKEIIYILLKNILKRKEIPL